jgi:hypothetical protein
MDWRDFLCYVAAALVMAATVAFFLFVARLAPADCL